MNSIVQQKAGYAPSGMVGEIRVETNPLLPKGSWVALDKDRNVIESSIAEDQRVTVIIPVTMRTIVCSPEIAVDLTRVLNGGV